jgi:hypothetical protein
MDKRENMAAVDVPGAPSSIVSPTGKLRESGKELLKPAKQ